MSDTTNFIDLTKYMQPGVYQIWCIPKNTFYFGQSENVLVRVGKHRASLKQKQHDCLSLQHDWNSLGADVFKFQTVCFGPQFESLEKRIAKQDELIKEKLDNSVQVSNSPKKRNSNHFNYRKIVQIEGVVYDSIGQAGRELPISETTIRRRLRDENYLQYLELAKPKQGYKKVRIGDLYFDSFSDVIKAGYAENRQQVNRRVNSTNKKWEEWSVYNTDKKRK